MFDQKRNHRKPAEAMSRSVDTLDLRLPVISKVQSSRRSLAKHSSVVHCNGETGFRWNLGGEKVTVSMTFNGRCSSFTLRERFTNAWLTIRPCFQWHVWCASAYHIWQHIYDIKAWSANNKWVVPTWCNHLLDRQVYGNITFRNQGMCWKAHNSCG